MAYKSTEKQREWYIKNRDRIIKKSVAWGKKNSEYRKEYARKYRENNRELVNRLSREWAKRNPDKIKESQRKAYKKTPQKSLEYNKIYREKNREKMKQQRHERYHNNIEYYKKYSKDRKEKYYLNKYKKIGVDIIEIRKDQDNKCAICKKEGKLFVDHCHTNLVVRGLLCHKCNAGIGMFNDDVESLKNAIKYIKLNKNFNAHEYERTLLK